ncbi:hypothetical protein MMC21_006421 [Puttea exsequens]|nr:hypothetical protein [Puttea exsequens]
MLTTFCVIISYFVQYAHPFPAGDMQFSPGAIKVVRDPLVTVTVKPRSNARTSLAQTSAPPAVTGAVAATNETNGGIDIIVEDQPASSIYSALVLLCPNADCIPVIAEAIGTPALGGAFPLTATTNSAMTMTTSLTTTTAGLTTTIAALATTTAGGSSGLVRRALPALVWLSAAAALLIAGYAAHLWTLEEGPAVEADISEDTSQQLADPKVQAASTVVFVYGTKTEAIIRASGHYLTPSMTESAFSTPTALLVEIRGDVIHVELTPAAIEAFANMPRPTEKGLAQLAKATHKWIYYLIPETKPGGKYSELYWELSLFADSMVRYFSTSYIAYMYSIFDDFERAGIDRFQGIWNLLWRYGMLFAILLDLAPTWFNYVQTYAEYHDWNGIFEIPLVLLRDPDVPELTTKTDFSTLPPIPGMVSVAIDSIPQGYNGSFDIILETGGYGRTMTIKVNYADTDDLILFTNAKPGFNPVPVRPGTLWLGWTPYYDERYDLTVQFGFLGQNGDRMYFTPQTENPKISCVNITASAAINKAKKCTFRAQPSSPEGKYRIDFSQTITKDAASGSIAYAVRTQPLNETILIDAFYPDGNNVIQQDSTPAPSAEWYLPMSKDHGHVRISVENGLDISEDRDSGKMKSKSEIVIAHPDGTQFFSDNNNPKDARYCEKDPSETCFACPNGVVGCWRRDFMCYFTSPLGAS